jgi:hypothetical protein
MAHVHFDRQLQRATERLVADLRTLIRQAAQASVRRALTGNRPDVGGKPAGERPEKPFRPLRAETSEEMSRTGKRTRQELEALTDMLLEYIEQNPGLHMEEISAGLGVPSRDLTLPMRILVRENHLRTLGEKRATTYYAR